MNTSLSDTARVALAVEAIREAAAKVPQTGDLDAIRRALLPVFDAAHDAGALLNDIEEKTRDAAIRALTERTQRVA